jgi:hypothetical protein
MSGSTCTADAGDLDDAVEALVDLAAREAEHDAVDVDVLAAGDLRMKAGAQFDQRGDASVDRHLSGCRFEDAGDDFQQRRFSGAVASDHAERFAAMDRERDLAQRGHGLFGRELEIAFQQRAFQRRELRAPSPEPVAFRDVL